MREYVLYKTSDGIHCNRIYKRCDGFVVLIRKSNMPYFDWAYDIPIVVEKEHIIKYVDEETFKLYQTIEEL